MFYLCAEFYLLPPTGGIVITWIVCWLVRSFVRYARCNFSKTTSLIFIKFDTDVHVRVGTCPPVHAHPTPATVGGGIRINSMSLGSWVEGGGWGACFSCKLRI